MRRRRFFGRGLDGLVVAAFVYGAAVHPVAAADQTFNLIWSGASFSNSASATATIVMDTALVPNPGNSYGGIPAWFKSITMTVTGASFGNGTFTLADFQGLYWDTGAAALDLSQQLVGQPTNAFPWGTANGSGGEFNLLGVCPAPTATYYFTLTTHCGDGDELLLTSFLMVPSAPSNLVSLLPKSAPDNVVNVAAAIDAFVARGGTLPADFQTLYTMSGGQLQAALPQLTGEAGASITQSSFMAMNQFFNMVFDPFVENRGGFGAGAMPFAADGNSRSDEVRLAYAAVTPKGAPAMIAKALPDPGVATRWGVWGGGYGGSATTDGNASLGSHDTRHRAYGFVAGADHKLTPDTLIGFALAGGGTSFDLANGLGGGTSDLFQASVYARQRWGAAYLMGAFGYGWQDVSTSRTITVAGTDTLEADFNANTFAGRVEGGWRFGSVWTGMTPYAALQIISIDLPGYSEYAASGAGTFAVAYSGRTDTQTRSELGARFDHAVPVQDALVTLRGRAAWAYDDDDDNVANAAFMSLPGAAFTVNGARPDANSLLLSAGAELSWRNGIALAGAFEGEFSNNTESYSGKGSVRYRW
jgi:uncharacterized protein with beta-barrel porin domain